MKRLVTERWQKVRFVSASRRRVRVSDILVAGSDGPLPSGEGRRR